MTPPVQRGTPAPPPVLSAPGPPGPPRRQPPPAPEASQSPQAPPASQPPPGPPQRSPGPPQRSPGPPAGSGRPGGPAVGTPRLTYGRPSYYPSGFAWVAAAVGRNWRGVLGALVATWFSLPIAVFLAVLCALVLGVAGAVGGTVASLRWVPPFVSDIPLLGSAVDLLMPSAGGVIGAVIGILLGLILGFVGALALFWWVGFADDPLSGVGSVLGVVAIGLLVGLFYTLYRMAFEPALLRYAGARRMSRRERDLIMPAVHSCARRLGLPEHPPVMIIDGTEPVATAYTRTIVINRGLLEEFDYDREVVAGVLCHELVHWRNGDAIAAAFVRGVALPLYAVYLGIRWLMRRADSRLSLAFTMAPLMVLIWAIFWPVVATVRFVVIPSQAREVRKAEFRADQGAARAGYRDGLRRVLTDLDDSFETGRNGWEHTVSAAHPPNELRLERLEDGAGYPLPGPRASRPTEQGHGSGDG